MTESVTLQLCQFGGSLQSRSAAINSRDILSRRTSGATIDDGNADIAVIA
jgi:hypothetical protein